MRNKMDNILVYSAEKCYVLLNLNNLRMLLISNESILNIREILSQPQYDYFFDEPKILCEPETIQINPIIFTGTACNYTCEYCYEQNYSKFNVMLDMPLDNIDLFYEQYCKHYNIPFKYGVVSLIGGEPLLETNRVLIERILKKWKDNKVIISTNGVNIMKYWDLLKNRDVELHVSLDGIKEIHYAKRHPHIENAYEKTIEGIKCALDNKKTVDIMTVFFPENANEYILFLDEMEQLGWLKNPCLQLNFILKLEGGSDLIDAEYYRNCIDTMFDLRKRDKRFMHVHIEKMLPGVTCFTLDKQTSTCNPYACEKLYMPSYVFNPNGQVSVCTLIQPDKLSVGQYFPEVKVNTEEIDLLKNRNVNNMDACVECKYALICKGGCIASTFVKGKDIFSPICDRWKNTNWMYAYEKLLI